MNSASQVETFLTGLLDEVLVSSNTASFKSFRGDLFLFKRDEMDTEWEIFDGTLLLTGIIDTDSWVRDTSVVTRLREWLSVPESIASSWSSSHG